MKTYKINAKEKSKTLRQGENSLIFCEPGLQFGVLKRLKKRPFGKTAQVEFPYRYRMFGMLFISKIAVFVSLLYFAYTLTTH